jgi:hypothetical protein
MPLHYLAKRIHPSSTSPITCDWESSLWKDVPPLAIDQFHASSSDHHPIVHAKIAHSGSAVHAIYRVQDRYVKSVGMKFQDMVCWDSCVEFFIEPKVNRGYFNFEMNCGGTLLVYYIEDPTPGPNGKFNKLDFVAPEHGALVRIQTTMPRSTPVEIEQPIEWRLAVSIPLAVMEPYVGEIGNLAGQTWNANLYKCGDRTSHPHWASWSNIGQLCAFHQPAKFGEIQFE